MIIQLIITQVGELFLLSFVTHFAIALFALLKRMNLLAAPLMHLSARKLTCTQLHGSKPVNFINAFPLQ